MLKTPAWHYRRFGLAFQSFAKVVRPLICPYPARSGHRMTSTGTDNARAGGRVFRAATGCAVSLLLLWGGLAATFGLLSERAATRTPADARELAPA